MRPRCGLVSTCCVLLASCAGVAPDPESASIDDLAVVTLDADAEATLRTAEREAVAAVEQRSYAAAAQAAEDARGRAPRSARARAVLAMVALHRASEQDPIEWRGLRRGESELALAQQLAPGDALVGRMHAEFLAETGHTSAAARAAEEALERCADAPDEERAALLGVAATYRYELGEERAALPHLRAYVALRPADAAAHFRLGACLLVIARTPQGVPPPYRRAQAEAQESARAFARCLELAPEDEDAALSIATAQLRAAELARLDRGRAREEREADAAALEQQALGHLRSVADSFAGSAEARFRLGVVAAQLEEQELAQASYRAALERDAEHVGSLLNLAAIESSRGERAAARALLERALAADGRLPQLSGPERRRITEWLAAPAESPAAGG